MKNTIIIIIFTILFSGCTISIPQPQPPIEEKKVVVQETGGYEPWPDGEKVYWYARYFFTMASNPKVQLLMTPRDAYEIAKCTVDGFEKDYKYEKFVEEIGEKVVLPPHTSKYVYNLSFECSVEVRRKIKSEFQKQDEKPITLEESI